MGADRHNMLANRLRLPFILAFLSALTSLSPTSPAQPIVSAIRTGQHAAWTRFVLDISEAVEYKIFTLRNPYRVVIDLPELQWNVFQGSVVETRGLIDNFRFGRFAEGVSRVVLDVSAPVEVHRAFLLPPRGTYQYRFVIDLAAVDAQAFKQTAGLAPPPRRAVAPKPKPKPRSPSQRRRIVVIDPGHGGVDPGTIGVRGTYEKTITLAFARELRAALLASGRYHIATTRNGDEFVRLRDRTKFAREAGGQLFISLHADSIKNHRIRGAAVYTLSETASDKEAAALAAKENRADALAGVDLSDETDDVSSILIDLAQRETMNMSSRFANTLVGEIGKHARLLRRSHRFAGFAVLKAPDMVSVLVELGYLSNRADERFLSSRTGRANLVTALVSAINAHFASVDQN